MKARVQRALEHCDAERIILAPDCGMKYLPREVSFGKLLVDVAAAKELRKDFPREHSARSIAGRKSRMKRSEDRILTTHVGSIPRPKAMLEMASMSTGPPKDPKAYAELVRSSVADIVKRQAAAGIDIVNDGELRQVELGELRARTHDRLRATPRHESTRCTGWAAIASASRKRSRTSFGNLLGTIQEQVCKGAIRVRDRAAFAATSTT